MIKDNQVVVVAIDQKGYKDLWNIFLILLIAAELTLGILVYYEKLGDLIINYEKESFIAYKLIFDAIVFIIAAIYFFRKQQNLVLLNILIYLIIIDIALRFVAQAKLSASEWDPKELKDIFSLLLYANQFLLPIVILFFSMRRKDDIRVIVKEIIKDPQVQQDLKDRYSSKIDHNLFFMS